MGTLAKIGSEKNSCAKAPAESILSCLPSYFFLQSTAFADVRKRITYQFSIFILGRNALNAQLKELKLLKVHIKKNREKKWNTSFFTLILWNRWTIWKWKSPHFIRCIVFVSTIWDFLFSLHLNPLNLSANSMSNMKLAMDFDFDIQFKRNRNNCCIANKSNGEGFKRIALL